MYVAKLLNTFHVSSVFYTVRILTTSTENTRLIENNAGSSTEARLMMISMKEKKPLFIRGCYYNEFVIFFTPPFSFLSFFSSFVFLPLFIQLFLFFSSNFSVSWRKGLPNFAGTHKSLYSNVSHLCEVSVPYVAQHASRILLNSCW